MPAAREHGPAADAAFAGPVPRALTDWLVGAPGRARRRRCARFGKRTARAARAIGRAVRRRRDAAEEIFTAWTYARYADAVAARGQGRNIGLPMYVNAALDRPGRRPANIRSGGPLAHLFDVWRAGAPVDRPARARHLFPQFRRDRAPPMRAPTTRSSSPRRSMSADPRHPGRRLARLRPRPTRSASAPSRSILPAARGPKRLGATYRPDRLARAAPPRCAARGAAAPASRPGAFDGDGRRHAAAGDARRLSLHRLASSTPGRRAAARRPGRTARLIIRIGPDDYLVAGSGVTFTFAPARPGRRSRPRQRLGKGGSSMAPGR